MTAVSPPFPLHPPAGRPVPERQVGQDSQLASSCLIHFLFVSFPRSFLLPYKCFLPSTSLYNSLDQWERGHPLQGVTVSPKVPSSIAFSRWKKQRVKELGRWTEPAGRGSWATGKTWSLQNESIKALSSSKTHGGVVRCAFSKDHVGL